MGQVIPSQGQRVSGQVHEAWDSGKHLETMMYKNSLQVPGSQMGDGIGSPRPGGQNVALERSKVVKLAGLSLLEPCFIYENRQL